MSLPNTPRALAILRRDPTLAQYELDSLQRGSKFDAWYFQSVPKNAQRILDIGCGSGRLTRALANRAAYAIGLDVSPAMLILAQDGKPNPPNVRWILASAEALPFPHSGFDMVVSSSALSLTDIPRAAAQIERVLKPGGSVALRDGLASAPSPRASFIETLSSSLKQSLELARHFGVRAGINALLRRSGMPRPHHESQHNWTQTELEQIYTRTFPGCRIVWRDGMYFLNWEKR